MRKRTGPGCPLLDPRKAYSTIMERIIGEDFNCEVDDVAEAMRDVYENYDAYLSESQERRQFAAQYDYSSLKKRYLNMVSPKVLKFGDVNEITEEGLTTTSRSYTLNTRCKNENRSQNRYPINY